MTPAGHPHASPPPPTRATAAIRDELASLLQRQPKTAVPVGRILGFLGEVERELASANARASTPGRARGPRRAEVVSHYRVEGGLRSSRDAALAEHRTSGAQPFRCPWEVYQAAARELGAAGGDGMSFNELYRRVNKRLGVRIPIYRIRMCLRFWDTANITQHWLKRFGPTDSAARAPGGFAAEARRAWERALTQPVVPRSGARPHDPARLRR